MRAARFHGCRDIRVEDVEEPEMKEGQILVNIEWCGICGSDLHEFLAGPTFIPTTDRPHPLTGSSLPITMGHEFCGRVSKAHKNSKLKVGQAVMVDPRINCKTCYACQSLRPNACSSQGFLGMSGGGGGGLSEMVAVDENMCYVLPDDVSLSQAALIEPLTVGRHALKASGFHDFTNTVSLVIGGGPVGLAVLLNLQAAGARMLIVSEPTAKRQQLTKEFADTVLDPRYDSVGDICRDLTKGAGVDLVFDCAGIDTGLRDGMDALRVGGTYINLAIWETPLILPLELYFLKEITIKPSLTYTNEDFQETVQDFIAGKFQGASKLITSRIHLDDVVEKGFLELVNNKDDQVKILVTPYKMQAV